jgi:hypothetical protein
VPPLVPFAATTVTLSGGVTLKVIEMELALTTVISASSIRPLTASYSCTMGVVLFRL